MQQLAEVEDEATAAAFQQGLLKFHRNLQFVMQMRFQRNQLPHLVRLILKVVNGQPSSNLSKVECLVLNLNWSDIQVHLWWMMVNGHKKSTKPSCAMRSKQSMLMCGILNVEKKQSEKIVNVNVKWKCEKLKWKQQGSWRVQHLWHWSILYLNQLNRVLPISRVAPRSFQEIVMETLFLHSHQLHEKFMQHSQLTHAQRQLFQDKMFKWDMVGSQGSNMFALQATLTGITLSKISSNLRCLVVQIQRSPKMIFDSFAVKCQSWVINDLSRRRALHHLCCPEQLCQTLCPLECSRDMDPQCHSLVQCPPTADDDCHCVETGKMHPNSNTWYQLRDDYIPKWQIFVEREETVQKQLVHWHSPTTIWEGRPVLGFMVETYLGDLMTVGFKHFNPMWSSPSTSVYQNWDPISFGMPAWHLTDDQSHDKDALGSQSPIVVFKAATILQSLGIISSRIILPSSDVKGEKKNKTYCPSIRLPVPFSSRIRRYASRCRSQPSSKPWMALNAF